MSNQLSNRVLTAIKEESSDTSLILEYLWAAPDQKPAISDRLEKKLKRILHVQDLLMTHKVEARVMEMVRTIYGLSSSAHAFELIREAKLINGSISKVTKSAERKFLMDWGYEKLRQFDEEGKDREFVSLFKEILKQYEGEDPDEDIMTKAQQHIILITPDPDAAGLQKVPKERIEQLRLKFLGNGKEQE